MLSFQLLQGSNGGGWIGGENCKPPSATWRKDRILMQGMSRSEEPRWIPTIETLFITGSYRLPTSALPDCCPRCTSAANRVIIAVKVMGGSGVGVGDSGVCFRGQLWGRGRACTSSRLKMGREETLHGCAQKRRSATMYSCWTCSVLFFVCGNWCRSACKQPSHIPAYIHRKAKQARSPFLFIKSPE